MIKNVICILKILTKTMGSPGAFEYRRQELKEIGKPHSDEDIVNSYRGIDFSFMDLLFVM